MTILADCQSERLMPITSSRAASAVSDALTGLSRGSVKASNRPSSSISVISAPMMKAGFCLMLRSSMPAIRLAWTSTPGYTAPTGVERRSIKPGAVVPTRTMAPPQFLRTDAAMQHIRGGNIGEAALLAAIGNQGADVLVHRDFQFSDAQPFQRIADSCRHLLRKPPELAECRKVSGTPQETGTHKRRPGTPSASAPVGQRRRNPSAG